MAGEDVYSIKLQITKELLEKLGIVDGLRQKFPNQPDQAEQLIAEYIKHFEKLSKGIH